MTTVPLTPVASSISCFMVTPAIMSRNSTLPAFSVRIGTLYGSHWTKASPFLTLRAVGDGDDRADDDVVALEFAAVLGVDGDGAVLVEHDASCRRGPARRGGRCNGRSPSFLALIDRLLERACDAMPPMWNVRMVSCVPGSPMDCAAMMPTASPSLTSWPVARLRP